MKESKDRVRAALANCGFELPAGHITVNLAPADLPKEGGRFDLPIAVGILVASAQLPTGPFDATELVWRAVARRRAALDPRRAADRAAGRAGRPHAGLPGRPTCAEAALAGMARVLRRAHLLRGRARIARGPASRCRRPVEPAPAGDAVRAGPRRRARPGAARGARSRSRRPAATACC
ncbi:MAG: hypothetical protein MZW92_13815 [Comamonadaceae bacterium]|nr:hypothetical protein [Comamonadaceae bacterium]